MQYGQNVEVALQDGKKGKRLIIEVDLSAKGEPSKTGLCRARHKPLYAESLIMPSNLANGSKSGGSRAVWGV
jgi:hypothetical protein